MKIEHIALYTFEMEKLKMKLAVSDPVLYEKVTYGNMRDLIAERGLEL